MTDEKPENPDSPPARIFKKRKLNPKQLKKIKEDLLGVLEGVDDWINMNQVIGAEDMFEGWFWYAEPFESTFGTTVRYHFKDTEDQHWSLLCGSNTFSTAVDCIPEGCKVQVSRNEKGHWTIGVIA